MTNDSGIELLLNVLYKIIIFIQRPHVQVQLIAIGVALFAASSLTGIFWRIVDAPLRRWVDRFRPRRVRPQLRILLSLSRAITLPVLGLILLRVGGSVLDNRGWLTGMLDIATEVLTTIITFQVISAFFYLVFNENLARRYRFRLLIPLQWVVIALQLLSHLTDLTAIAGIVITNIFNSPVTIRALFIATFGLYFWADVINSLADTLYQFIVKRTSLDPGGAKAVLTLARYLLILVGFSYALSQFQFDATTLAAITGGLSVGIGFGLREVLSNFISGILLLFERSLHPGDVIEVDDELSVVQNLSVRATTVRTLNNVELVIPNQTFFTQPFKTYTGSNNNVRLPIDLLTDCNISPLQVVEVLKEAALSHPQVLKEPEPSVFILEYANNVARFQLNIWIDDPLRSPQIRSEVKLLAWDALKEHGIALPFPEMELHFNDSYAAQTLAAGAG